MSFRDNLQHLRATRSMTQEQLAMLLGVSRQSVSKWEAEKAYPEMDKLLKICDLFGCTLDDLVSGNMTDRPAGPVNASFATSKPQDVTGYDQVMVRVANRISLGIALLVAAFALVCVLAAPGIASERTMQVIVAIPLIAVIVAGLALIIPAGLERSDFRRRHPFVEDFYTEEDRARARSRFSMGLVVGIAFCVTALAGAALLDGMSTEDYLSGVVFFGVGAPGVLIIVRSSMMRGRMSMSSYNEEGEHSRLRGMDAEDVDDPRLRAKVTREHRYEAACGIIMSLATVVGLALLFIPVFHAQSWFWAAWPIGAVLCGFAKHVVDMR